MAYHSLTEKDEHVISLDIGATWEPNVPNEVLVQVGGRATLVLDPHFDDSDQRLVAIDFYRCMAAYLGPPNDEARFGHPLWNAGLREVLWVGEILHSSWIARLEMSNRVHPEHTRERFAQLRHLILPLKSNTLEVVARGVAARRPEGTLDEVVGAAVQVSA